MTGCREKPPVLLAVMSGVQPVTHQGKAWFYSSHVPNTSTGNHTEQALTKYSSTEIQVKV